MSAKPITFCLIGKTNDEVKKVSDTIRQNVFLRQSRVDIIYLVNDLENAWQYFQTAIREVIEKFDLVIFSLGDIEDVEEHCRQIKQWGVPEKFIFFHGKKWPGKVQAPASLNETNFEEIFRTLKIS